MRLLPQLFLLHACTDTVLYLMFVGCCLAIRSLNFNVINTKYRMDEGYSGFGSRLLGVASNK